MIVNTCLADQLLHQHASRRTPLANETIEIAFMLLCFHSCGATITTPLLWWARKTLAQNGELRPDQVETLQ